MRIEDINTTPTTPPIFKPKIFGSIKNDSNYYLKSKQVIILKLINII